MKTKWYMGVLAVAACLFAAACKNTTSEQQGGETEGTDTPSATDSTEWVGVCGDGTSMNALELVTGDDTLYISLVEARDSDRVYGGLEVGDSIYVWLRADADVDEEQTAQVVVNLNELKGDWIGARNDGSECAFTLAEGHNIKMEYGNEADYTSWRIQKGKLLLSTGDDAESEVRAFDLQLLYSDSLLLKSGNDSWKLGKK